MGEIEYIRSRRFSIDVALEEVRSDIDELLGAEPARDTLATRFVAKKLGEVHGLFENVRPGGVNDEAGAKHQANAQAECRPDESEQRQIKRQRSNVELAFAH